MSTLLVPARRNFLSSSGKATLSVAAIALLAGRADLIAGFLEAQASPAKVRSQLLAAQADASPEIVSRIAPDAAAAAHTPAANPLIDAAKQLAAKSASVKKEH